MKYNQNEERFCLYCGEILEGGRRDKKYCDRKCNNAFNNERRREELDETLPFTRQFKRTHHALKKIYLDSLGKKYISLTNAIELGLDLRSICRYFKEDRFPSELTRIANYAYYINEQNHTIIVFKLN